MGLFYLSPAGPVAIITVGAALYIGIATLADLRRRRTAAGAAATPL